MAFIPLSTKLHKPLLQPNPVERPHLMEHLNEGLRLGRRLTLITAPAGFGKTTLAVQWLDTAGRPFAWLSLEASDNDPIRFADYLIGALQALDPSLGRQATALLQGAVTPSLQEVLTLLINELVALPRPIGLVLDDYHFITQPELHQALIFFIEHLPASVHLLLISRHVPPFPCHRLRARGQLTEVTMRDCLFRHEEAAVFLTASLSLALPQDVIDKVALKTEGWIAGLQIAGLSLRHQLLRGEADLAEKIKALDSRHRHLFDYFSTEVVGQQTAEVQVFLRQISVLERFTASLCEAVTGHSDCQRLLAQLEQANLFLIPLDERREWYRFHHLFADVLRAGLSPEQEQALQRQAAVWFEAHGFIPEAIGHARAGQDTEITARLISEFTTELIRHYKSATLIAWLADLPPEMVQANSRLALRKGQGLLYQGRLAEADAYITLAQKLQAPDAPAAHRGEVLAFMAEIAFFRGDYGRMFELATAALARLENSRLPTRVVAYLYCGEGYWVTGDTPTALRHYENAIRFSQQAGFPVGLAAGIGIMALHLHECGQRQAALARCRQALDILVDAQGRSIPEAYFIQSGLGLLYYEANELAQAQTQFERGIASVTEWGGVLQVGISSCHWARTLYAQGEVEQAFARLATVLQAEAQAGGAEMPGLAASVMADLQRREGHVAAVERWAAAAGFRPGHLPADQPQEAHLTYIRLLLAKGQAKVAHRHLTGLAETVQQQVRYGRLMTVFILRALAERALGRPEPATRSLARALSLAAPEAYIRTFLDEGPAVAELLPAVRHVAPAFVDTLLAAFTVAAKSPPEQGSAERSRFAVARSAERPERGTRPAPRTATHPRRFELRLFGALRFWLHGQAITGLYSGRVRALLAYLAAHPGQTHSRDALMALLWDEYPEREARANLRNALAQLKKILTPVTDDSTGTAALLAVDRHTVELRLDPGRDWVDLWVFDRLLSACQSHAHERLATCTACLDRLGQAVRIYNDSFLTGVILGDSPAFEDWRLLVQEERHRQALLALDTLTGYHAAQGNTDQVKAYARQQLVLEPWHEAAHQRLMQALMASGECAAALAQYTRYEQVLRDELGFEPSPMMQALVEQARLAGRHSHPGYNAKPRLN